MPKASSTGDIGKLSPTAGCAAAMSRQPFCLSKAFAARCSKALILILRARFRRGKAKSDGAGKVASGGGSGLKSAAGFARVTSGSATVAAKVGSGSAGAAAGRGVTAAKPVAATAAGRGKPMATKAK